MASKETVKRLSPAAASDLAFADKAAPFVVTATSRGFPFQVLSLEELDAFSQQGLAARQTNLFDAVRGKDFGKTNDFLKREDFSVGKEAVVLLEFFLRHAVAAAEITAVSDRNSDIA